MNNSKITPTRFWGLGYKCEAPNTYSFYDTDTKASIGPKYTSENELLADVYRFATERGYSE